MALLFYRNNLEVKFYRNNLENKLKIKVANELPDVRDGQYSPANFAPIFSSKFSSTQEDTSSDENSFMGLLLVSLQHELSSGDLEESIFLHYKVQTRSIKLSRLRLDIKRHAQCTMGQRLHCTLHEVLLRSTLH